jgi:DNA-binding FrmR family transcriptional regulator
MLIGCSVSLARAIALAFHFYHTPLGYTRRLCFTSTKKEKKLLARIKRTRGLADSIERSLTEEYDCADVLMLLTNIRGGINSLMAAVFEDHIRHHLLSPKEVQLPLTT